MSYFGSIKFADSGQLDAFGRLRTSTPYSLFDNMGEYGNNTFFWESSVTGGSVTNVANQCAVRLSTGGTTSANKAIRQTKAYHRYQPGRSLNVETTFVISAMPTNATARIGYFDASNGIFFQRTKGASTTTNYIVRRTNTSGTPADAEQVAQDNWNVDKMDGNGVSGKTIDFTKTQILFIQLQFLGVGRVQVGFVIDGIAYVAHQFLNANSLSTVYMSTGCLPVRGEVINDSTSGGTLTMDMICTSVSSGGQGLDKLRYSISNGTTSKSTTTTLTPIISIRAAQLLGGTTGGGSITNRGKITIADFSVSVASQTHEVQVVYNPTSLTGVSWQNYRSLSIADYDISATAISGGTIIDSSYLGTTGAARNNQIIEISQILPIVYSGLNSTQDIVTIAARTVSTSGSAYAAMSWTEEY